MKTLLLTFKFYGAIHRKPIRNGVIATLIMLILYFLVVGLISDWSFAKTQFATYWYFIISLALGFGIQVDCTLI